MGYIDLGSIGYDLTLRKDASWTGGITTAEGDLQKLGSAMAYNERSMDSMQREMFDTSAEMRKMAAAGDTTSDAYRAQATRLNTLQTEYGQAEKATKEFRTEIERVAKSTTISAATVSDGAKKMGKGFNDAADKTRGLSMGAAAVGVAAVAAGISFESSFAEVRKSVGGTEEQLAAMRAEILLASETHPISPDAIAEVYAMGGQLGVTTENLGAFADAAIGMSVATNLSLEEGGAQMAKFSNIMGTASREGVEGFSKLGSTLVELGNNGASTEADIMAMSLRIAGAARQVGMSEGDVLGLANALSSMGIEAESGGSAVSKTMSEIDKAVAKSGQSAKEISRTTGVSLKVAERQFETNSRMMKTWADTAGMSTAKFKDAWEKDAAGALGAVFKGMGEVKAEGGNLNLLLEELDIKELRQSDMLKRVSGAADLLTDSVKTGNKAWSDNAAMQKEVDARYATTASKLGVLGNKARIAGMDLADGLMPMLEDLMATVEDIVAWFRSLSAEWKKVAAIATVVVAAIYPILKVLGFLSNALGWLMAAFAEGGALAWLIPMFEGIGAAIAGITAPVWGTVAIIVAAGAAIIAAGYFIITYWDEISAFFAKLWSDISAAFTAGWAAIVAGWNSLVAWLAGVWTSITTAVTAGITALVAAFLTTFAPIITGVQTIFGGIATFFGGFWEVVKNIFLGAVLLIIDLFSGNFTRLQTDAAAIWANIMAGIDLMWAGITAIWTGAIGMVVGMWNGFKASIMSVWNYLKTAVPAAVASMTAAVVAKYESVKTSVTNAVGAMVHAVSSKFAEVLAFVATIPDKLRGFFTSLPDRMATIGGQIVDGLKRGITNAWSAVVTTVGNLANGIADTIRNILGIHSPSRVMVDLMESGVGAGIVNGLMNTVRSVTRAAGAVATAISDTIAGSSVGIDLATMPVSGTLTASGALAGGNVTQTTIYQVGDVSVDATQLGGDLPSFFDDIVRLKRMGLA